jgi:hypothetical protein
MLDAARNLRTSAIELRQSLPALERDWLLGRLRAHPDISAAASADDARQLTIEYDADRLVSADLVDWLNRCGVRVAAVHARGCASTLPRR